MAGPRTPQHWYATGIPLPPQHLLTATVAGHWHGRLQHQASDLGLLQWTKKQHPLRFRMEAMKVRPVQYQQVVSEEL